MSCGRTRPRAGEPPRAGAAFDTSPKGDRMSTSTSPERSWKDGAGPGTSGRRLRRTRGWHPSPAGPTDPGRPWRQTRAAKVGFAAALLLGVLAATVLVIRWWQPLHPPRVVLLEAGYEGNLRVPSNHSGVRGLDAWERCVQARSAAGNSGRIEVRRAKLEGDEAVNRALHGDSWVERTRAGRTRLGRLLGRKAPAVVVVVAAHGVAQPDEEGRLVPYLVR